MDLSPDCSIFKWFFFPQIVDDTFFSICLYVIITFYFLHAWMASWLSITSLAHQHFSFNILWFIFSLPLGISHCKRTVRSQPNFFSFYLFIYFISWRLITLQYCSGFCHTLTWISHGYTCIPHPDPPSHLPLHPIPLGLPIAAGPSTCLMHPTWAGDLFHPR